MKTRFQNVLSRHQWLLSVVAGVSAFGVYSSMYAFRKSFAAGTYTGLKVGGIDYKTALVIAQVFGYMLSKFFGISFVSGMEAGKRTTSVLLLIGISWLALLAFAIVPAPYNIACLFINGLPLGMIWGLVFSFLEGRRNTELMAAIMASSIIFASGFVKSTGRMLLQLWHVPEFWMPFTTGLLFVVPLCFFLFILNNIPSPSTVDVAARSERKPMSRSDRASIVREYWPGLALICFTYLMLTVVVSIRDNFEVEIWSGLGYGKQSSIYTSIDFPVSVAVLIAMAVMIKVKNNLKAFVYIHGMILVGCLLVLGSTLLFMYGIIGPVIWMTCAALGIYLSYIPYNSIFFERMIASFAIVGNVGFVMYLADSLGYFGSVGVLLFRQAASADMSWLTFFTRALLVLSSVGIASVLLSMNYFINKYYVARKGVLKYDQ